jgi:hypothetical protein
VLDFNYPSLDAIPSINYKDLTDLLLNPDDYLRSTVTLHAFVPVMKDEALRFAAIGKQGGELDINLHQSRCPIRSPTPLHLRTGNVHWSHPTRVLCRQPYFVAKFRANKGFVLMDQILRDKIWPSEIENTTIDVEFGLTLSRNC